MKKGASLRKSYSSWEKEKETLNKIWAGLPKEVRNNMNKIFKKYNRFFSSEPRMRIVSYLTKNKDASITEISEYLDITFRNTQPHINMLIEDGLITKTKEGKFTKINLTPQGKEFSKLCVD